MADKAVVHKQYLQRFSEQARSNPREGRRALVVGAPEQAGEFGNIGAGIATALAQSGVQVHKVDRLDGYNAGDPHMWQRMLPEIDPDIVVFANGESWLDWIEDQPMRKVDNVIFNTLIASIIGTQEFVRYALDKPHRKHLVYICSMAAKAVLNASGPYCAAKAGLHQFAKCMAWELTPKGFDVNIIHPSNTADTPMTEETIAGVQRYRGFSREEAEEYWSAINSLGGHWPTTAEIGDLVATLVTKPWARNLSGADIEIRAGQR
jgi:NAD(P)-dependent dehydrogenase (short-subunit alcohol dehydrogenase family)